MARIYGLVVHEAKLVKSSGSDTKKGHTFEDIVSRSVYDICLEVDYQCKSARHTPNLPTFSGARHQFDCWFGSEDVDYVVECKRRKMATKDQIYYLNARLIDYVLGLKQRDDSRKIKGVFVSTAPVDDNSLSYSFAYAMDIIEPGTPPIEHMISEESDPVIREGLNALYSKLPKFNPLFGDVLENTSSFDTLVKDYRYLLRLMSDKKVPV